MVAPTGIVVTVYHTAAVIHCKPLTPGEVARASVTERVLRVGADSISARLFWLNCLFMADDRWSPLQCMVVTVHFTATV